MPEKNKDATQLFNGTAAAPSLAFAGDQDTGIYQSADGLIDFAAGGVRAAQITAVASAVNYLDIVPAAASSNPIIRAEGTDTNVSIALTAKAAGGVVVTGTGTSALAVGANGATNPVFAVDANTASVATGVKVTGAAAASGVAVAVVSSGTNENLTIDAKGSGTITLNGTATGNVISGTGLFSKHATAGIGYSTGAGGTVTQATSITTGVTLNKAVGQITTVAATTAAGAEDTFTVTNSAVAATDMIPLTTTYAGGGLPLVYVSKVAAGSFNVTISNLAAAAALDAALTINFAVIKGVTS